MTHLVFAPSYHLNNTLATIMVTNLWYSCLISRLVTCGPYLLPTNEFILTTSIRTRLHASHILVKFLIVTTTLFVLSVFKSICSARESRVPTYYSPPMPQLIRRQSRHWVADNITSRCRCSTLLLWLLSKNKSPVEESRIFRCELHSFTSVFS